MYQQLKEKVNVFVVRLDAQYVAPNKHAEKILNKYPTFLKALSAIVRFIIKLLFS
ncbi:hypothetical protein [Paenibacillus sp. FSL R5-0701]|uniref:hypothetical protein n=1 Tax=Paenibacillus sp. FSL R5-0701 TaxID=2921654 RepID=UPI0030D12687